MIKSGTGIKSAVIGFAILALAGCAASYRNHGYAPSDEDLSQIVVGVDTRATVEETVGPPSSSGVLSDGGYYYVKSRVRQFAFRGPEVVERQLVAISFDEQGVVQNVEQYGLEDGQAVPIARRVTDNGIQTTSILRELLKNLGRFSPGSFGDG